MHRIHIIIDEEEERQQRLKAFNKVIELYCANLKERATHTPTERVATYANKKTRRTKI